MNKVAVFVDWENIRIEIKTYPNLQNIKNFIELNFGEISLSRIYIPDLPKNEKISLSIEEIGFTTQRYPKIKGYGSFGTDCDGFLIYQLAVIPYEFPHISVIVILCGDGHILPTVRFLRERGKKVIVIAPISSINHVLKQNCDRFYDYFKIVSN